jgi:putative Mn2+ efflux pump MntP
VTNPRIGTGKIFLIAAFFGFFQGAKPVLGYFTGNIANNLVTSVAPYVSLTILSAIGLKMLFDSNNCTEDNKCELSIGKLTLQAIATSIDAFAVGISFLAVKAAGNSLPFNVFWCGAFIGIITFALTLSAVLMGKYFTLIIEKRSANIKQWSYIAAGLVLIAIGIKNLLEAYF